jgi:hypothetical protein
LTVIYFWVAVFILFMHVLYRIVDWNMHPDVQDELDLFKEVENRREERRRIRAERRAKRIEARHRK